MKVTMNLAQAQSSSVQNYKRQNISFGELDEVGGPSEIRLFNGTLEAENNLIKTSDKGNFSVLNKLGKVKMSDVEYSSHSIFPDQVVIGLKDKTKIEFNNMRNLANKDGKIIISTDYPISSRSKFLSSQLGLIAEKEIKKMTFTFDHSVYGLFADNLITRINKITKHILRLT